jgi:hypothetical protein
MNIIKHIFIMQYPSLKGGRGDDQYFNTSRLSQFYIDFINWNVKLFKQKSLTNNIINQKINK